MLGLIFQTEIIRLSKYKHWSRHITLINRSYNMMHDWWGIRVILQNVVNMTKRLHCFLRFLPTTTRVRACYVVLHHCVSNTIYIIKFLLRTRVIFSLLYNLFTRCTCECEQISTSNGLNSGYWQKNLVRKYCMRRPKLMWNKRHYMELVHDLI